MPIWSEVAIGASPIMFTLIGGIWYLARLFGSFDTRLSVMEALFKDHCKRDRRQTGEWTPVPKPFPEDDDT